MSDELSKFKAQIAVQLDKLTQQEWIAANPGKHLWGAYRGHDSCAHCGIVRRRDDNNSPCKGIVKVGLRK